MIVTKTGLKGYTAEESLRAYFRSIGYFVVRGIPLVYKGYDVTDVDLWLYAKSSSLFAERVCIDIKRRKTPQAMERVLWTKGLKEILGLDHAIVVTSDSRPETREFGFANNVGVLQNEFLQRVISNYSPQERISEEEFLSILKAPCVIDSKVEWRAWFHRRKSRLLDSLNFDGCNTFIVSIRLLLEEYLATGKSSLQAVRLLYVIIGYLLISIDYTSRSFISLDILTRTRVLTDGFRYGEAGRQRTEEIVRMAIQLISDVTKTNLFPVNNLRSEFDKQVSEYNSEVMAEHFAKPESLKNLFAYARAFEEIAYAKTFQLPNELPSELKGVIGILCDLLHFDRKAII